ncbi:MAG: hypothetical protein MJK07_02350 [Flavobacteriales bacterium]|nr:hypothetical protein [Flavobacteriales bacterium]
MEVARTNADLDGASTIGTRHIAKAVQYRSLDREEWGGKLKKPITVMGIYKQEHAPLFLYSGGYP